MDIIGSIVLSIAQSILFYNKQLGISCVIFSILFNGIMFYILYKKNKIENKKGVLLIIPIILLSCTYFIFANKTFYILNILVLLVLHLIMYIIVTNKKTIFKNYISNVTLLFGNTIIECRESIDLSKKFTKKHLNNDKITRENIKKFLISFLVVSITVGIVLILLLSADMIFANLFSGIGKLIKNINIQTSFNCILRIIIILIAYILFLSLFIQLQKDYKQKNNKSKGNKYNYSFTIKLLLIFLNIIYFVFCFIQIQSLFIKININGSFDYATYARTGFFQLMFVTFINLAIILISGKYNKENIIKILNLLLILFTIIIAISSMYRMYMYETEYGLTYLRTFVYLILITEIITFVPILIYIFKNDFDFIKWCFIIIISSYCITNYINIEKIIVYKNINRNSNHSVDYIYIQKIASEDTYEILEEKAKDDNLNNKDKIEILNILYNIATNVNDFSWQEFNISKYRIREKDINTEKINNEINEYREINKMVLEENQKNKDSYSNNSKNYIYNEHINNNEEYIVEIIDTVSRKIFMGHYKNN